MFNLSFGTIRIKGGINMKINVEGFSANQKLQRAYDLINSGQDRFFIRQCLRAIDRLSNTNEFISSCDVWDLLDNANIIPNNPRSMGVAVKLAHKNGLIQRTDNYRPSRRKQANQRPVRIWRLVK